MKIEQIPHNQIKITESNGAIIQSQSVESNLLFAILEKLEEIRCNLIDVENVVANHESRSTINVGRSRCP